MGSKLGRAGSGPKMAIQYVQREQRSCGDILVVLETGHLHVALAGHNSQIAVCLGRLSTGIKATMFGFPVFRFVLF